MSAYQELTTVLKSVLTLLAPSPVPVTVDTHWQLMDGLVVERKPVVAHLLKSMAVFRLQDGLIGTHKQISSVNG